jgi:Flp pilus assembly secretin CpaC
MVATEQQVRMAVRLYEARDAAKRLLGEKYKARMAELGGMLTQLAAERKCDVLVAATKAAAGFGSGFDKLLIVAAAVELTEPSA